MKTISAFAVGLALAVALPTASAKAGAVRTFVSPTGSDSNNCSLAAPCRYFQAAYAQTSAGGEIAVLGTAGYNNSATFTIDKAISIVNPGGFEAGIFVPSGGIGILIIAGPNDAVSLRGLTIEGAGVGQTGILFNTGKSLTIDNCIVRHLVGDGIDFLTTESSALFVSNTVASDSGNSGIAILSGAPGPVTAVFNRVQANNNGNHGIFVGASNSTSAVNAAVYDSVAARNGLVGFYSYTAQPIAAQVTTLELFHSVAARNGTGVKVDGVQAFFYIANSMVTGNDTGWSSVNAGNLVSYGDNYFNGNSGGNTGTLNTISRQ